MNRQIQMCALAFFCAMVSHASAEGPKPEVSFGKAKKNVTPQSLGYAPDGKLLAWVEAAENHEEDSKLIHVWDVANAKEVLQLKGPKGAWATTPVVISPDGQYVAFATMHSEGGPAKSDTKSYAQLRVWDIKQGQALDRFKKIRTCDGGEFTQLAFSSDSRYLVTLRESQAERWKLSDGSSDGFSYGDDSEGGVFGDALSTGGAYFAYVLNQNPVEIWDIAKKKQVAKLEKAGMPIAFTTKMIVTKLEDRFQLWETATYSKRAEVEGDKIDPGAAIIVSDDGKWIAYLKDKAIQLYDVEAKKKRSIEIDAVKIAFAPDGKTLASYNRDGTVSIWRAAKAK